MSNASTLDSIQERALGLQPEARVRLAHSLVQSLAGLTEQELAALWLSEAEHRDSELESGQMQGIPGDEVFDRIRGRVDK